MAFERALWPCVDIMCNGGLVLKLDYKSNENIVVNITVIKYNSEPSKSFMHKFR